MIDRAIVVRRLFAAVAIIGLMAGTPVAIADNFVVNDGGWSADNNKGDGICADINNKCTLNAAIEEGNFRSGSHTITFSPAVTKVTLTNALQELRAPFTVTGNAATRTILDGTGVFGCFSLADSGDIPTGHFATGADGSSILNMVIQNCNSDGISANGHGYTFLNNYIGTDASGLLPIANKGHGISVSASRVYSNETNNFLQNLFGSFPVQPLSSTDIATFASQINTLIANALLGPIQIRNNVISGNQKNGVFIFSENLAGTFVASNKIGTDFSGNLALPNGESGIQLVGGAFGNLIGPDNVISGNTKNGIQNDAGAVALPNFVMGNRIGVSATLVGANIGNQLSGISVNSKPDTAVGHLNPAMIAMIIGPANVISDNQGTNNNAFPDVLSGDSAGIIVTGSSSDVKILGNTIGLVEFPPGTPITALDYGNSGDGIIVTVSGVTIGGSSAGQGNVIAGNARHGIVIRGSGVNGTKVLGNSIGVHPALANNLTLGNGADGIHISSASTSFIGGSGATDYNVIAANGRNGVKIRLGNFTNGWANLLQRNLIYGNAVKSAGVGIDLDNVENATNPQHSEIPNNYSNLDQASPVICSGTAGEPAACSGFQAAGDAGGSTRVDWVLTTHGVGTLPTTYRAEFFKINASSDNAATSMTFLGEQTVTTDLAGVISCPGGRCSANINAPSAGGYIVMTVTDATAIPDTLGGGWLAAVKCIVFTNCFVNDTSEFSNVVQAVMIPVSTSTTVTVLKPAGTANATPVASSVYGQAVAVTATVTATSGAVAPTGNVTITAGASSCTAALGSPQSLTSTATCTLAPAPTVAGSPYAVIASYTATPGFNASTSSGAGNGALTVAKAGTTATISAHTPDPSNVNAPIVVSAGVAVTAPGGGTPTGTITVSDGTSNCTITLPATSCNLVPTSAGAKSLTATYAGDANFAGSASAAVSHTVNPTPAAQTSTTVSQVAPQTGVYGQTIAVTVTVTALSGAVGPTGTVAVSAGGSACVATLGAPVALVATGSCNLAPALPVNANPYAVTAAYAGAPAFAPSASSGAGNGSVTVNKATTTAAITAHTPDPSTVNAAIAVTAGVSVTAPGSGTPTGTIIVSDGTVNCTITLPATSCNLTPTTSGAKNLIATYSGDANFNGIASPPVSHTVNPVAAIATSTVVTTVNPAIAVFGQAVSVTASVTAASGASAPTGNVTISAGGSSCSVALGSPVALTSKGTCNLAPSLGVSANAYPVSASYAGNATFAASASSGGGNGSVTINKAATTATISAHTPDPSNVNAPIVVSAGVAVTAPGGGTPTGTITVSDGTSNCTITLPATSCNLVPTSAGAKSLTATYAGDANFAGSASAAVSHTVNPTPAAQTSTTVSQVAPQTGVYGQTIAVTVTVTALSGAVGPTGTVAVSAGGSACVATLGAPVALVATGSCNLAPALPVNANPYAVTAAYAGAPAFAPSASSGAGNGSVTVNKATTTAAITAHTPDPSTVNAAIAVTAGVSVTAPGSGTPTGTIIVSDGTVNCTITLPATSCNLTPTTSGAKNLIATYSGDGNFNGSVSPGVSQTVNPAGPVATTTAVTTVNPAVAVFGQPISVTATVTAAAGATAPTGSVRSASAPIAVRRCSGRRSC